MKRQTVRIQYADGSRPEVAAWVQGPFALHKGQYGQTLTHLPTGCYMFTVPTLKDGKALVKRLCELADYRAETADVDAAIKALIPVLHQVRLEGFRVPGY